MRRGDYQFVNTSVRATVTKEWLLGPSMLRLIPHLPETMEQELGDSRWLWMIIEPVTARVIGDIGFHTPMYPDASIEIGYSVIPQTRGFGYTTEAGKALVHWTFANTTVAQIIAQIVPSNAASLRVAAKLGMRELPARTFDHRCFGISRSEIR